MFLLRYFINLLLCQVVCPDYRRYHRPSATGTRRDTATTERTTQHAERVAVESVILSPDNLSVTVPVFLQKNDSL